MKLNWENDFQITAKIEDKIIHISANRAGLISLANHLTALAQEVPGSHIHLDEFNSLEDNSNELIIERTE